MSMMAENAPLPLFALQATPPSSDESDADVMTKEEEEAANKYLRSTYGGAEGASPRRMSSLDVYLATQKEDTTEPMILNRRASLRQEEEEISSFDFEAMERKRKEEKQIHHLQVKEKMMEDRRRKSVLKEEIEKDREAFHKHIQLMKERKRRGLGGLTREKRNRLKEMIMNKAHEEMRQERLMLEKEKEKHLQSIVEPLNTDGLNEDQLQKKVRELYDRMVELENIKVDLESKIYNQELEMHDLTERMSELKGKYNRPVLKKVCKRQTKLERLLHLRESATNAHNNESSNMRDRLHKTSKDFQKNP